MLEIIVPPADIDEIRGAGSINSAKERTEDSSNSKTSKTLDNQYDEEPLLAGPKRPFKNCLIWSYCKPTFQTCVALRVRALEKLAQHKNNIVRQE